MIIRFLHENDFEEILSAFNESFNDYFIPTKLDKISLYKKIKEQNINFKYSVGAFEGSKLLGFILHSKFIQDNCNCLYNAGTGVLPSYRGQKLTSKMYEFVESNLHDHNIRKIYLEVIFENIAAQKAYFQVGFTQIRELNCYKKKSNELAASDLPCDFTNVNVIKLKDFSASEFAILQSKFKNRPAYQNSFFVLANILDELICLKFKESFLIGNSKNGRIYQIQSGIAEDLEVLFSKFINSVTLNFNIEKVISFVNLDAGDLIVNSLFMQKKFDKFITQKELCKVIEFSLKS